MAADGMLNIRTFGKRQVLMNQDDDADNVGVMLSGTAFLESMNQEGQRRILDYYCLLYTSLTVPVLRLLTVRN